MQHTAAFDNAHVDATAITDRECTFHPKVALLLLLLLLLLLYS